MSLKKIIFIGIVVILVGVIAVLFVLSQLKQAGESVEINFNTSGYMVQNNPGLQPETWYLVYEQPGSPALDVELAFDSQSSCFISDQLVDCATFPFYIGEPVHVEGIEKNKIVVVRELIGLSDIERLIQLYYYDPEHDKDDSGNINCSRNGLVVVGRQIPITVTPIQDTIRLLLEGGLTPAEKDSGITTEYPLPGFELKGADLKDGQLTLEFADPQNKTVGGACRVGVLWFQIEQTALQFPEVKSVKFIPEELFQP